MIKRLAWFCVFLAIFFGSTIQSESFHDPTNLIAVRIAGYEELDEETLHQRAQNLAIEHGLELVRQVGQLKGYYVFKGDTSSLLDENDIGNELERRQNRISRNVKRLSDNPNIDWVEHQKPLARKKRDTFEPDLSYLTFTDPNFADQWHLIDKKYGYDVNVTGVWEQGIYGEGVVVALVDDGIDFNHPDLAENYCAQGSYDFNFMKAEPLPSLSDDYHGTRCAGEIAAVVNDRCGVGVAYKSKVSGIRILSGDVTDEIEAASLNYMWDVNHIYSNSWGPYDNGATVEAPGKMCTQALAEGVKRGRKGLGSIFVFASGNGGSSDDCNYDGYTNSIYTISIGAIDRKGGSPSYQENCAAQLAVTSSNNYQDFIVSTDFHNKCTNRHGGTSAAAPLGAGILTLVLQIRPDLTWRDIQWLIVETALKVDDDHVDWSTNGAGYHFNHRYGFGMMSAYNIVERAKTWELIGPHIPLILPKINENKLIPDGDELISTYEFKEEYLPPLPENSTHFKLEHVQVVFTAQHERRGDISVSLVSPSGARALLGKKRSRDSSNEGFNDWIFMTVKYWGESPVGDWKLIVNDNVPEKTGTLVSWSLNLYLVGSDGPIPTQVPVKDDDDHQPEEPDDLLQDDDLGYDSDDQDPNLDDFNQVKTVSAWTITVSLIVVISFLIILLGLYVFVRRKYSPTSSYDTLEFDLE